VLHLRNIKLTVEYHGGNYCGFQIQEKAGLPTIQGVLEGKLSLLAKEKIRIIGAGRTDSGVHAKGQVVNFFSKWKIPIDRVVVALNSVLPKDIVVIKAEEVPEEFHARFSPKAKSYRYQIYNSNVPSAFQADFAWFVPYSLDFAKMQQGAAFFLGTHDFASFKSSGSAVKNNVREIHSLELVQDGPLITINIKGNGFLYNMVRIITGTLVEVGKGRISPSDVKTILEAKDREKSGPTAPPQGLFLIKVGY